jgi:hypothetical protein
MPPLASPSPADAHILRFASFRVETRHTGFDIDELAHFLIGCARQFFLKIHNLADLKQEPAVNPA